MAETFEPSTAHSINPYDAKQPLLFIKDDQRASHIRRLTIFTEAASGELRSELIDFLARLHALEMFVIHWRALDWLQLGEAGLQAFVRLFSLPSLMELQVLASVNFPLCLLQYFMGRKLCISATTTVTSVMPLLPADIQARKCGALRDMMVGGARNIQEIRTFIEWQTDRAQVCLRFINCLRCNISWRDSGAKPQEVMRVLGSFLLKIGSIVDCLEEFHFLDWQNSVFITLGPSPETWLTLQVFRFFWWPSSRSIRSSIPNLIKTPLSPSWSKPTSPRKNDGFDGLVPSQMALPFPFQSSLPTSPRDRPRHIQLRCSLSLANRSTRLDAEICRYVGGRTG